MVTSQISSNVQFRMNPRFKERESIMAPRTIELSVAKARGGRLQVTIIVAPTEDLDARGGVYVDFRLGSKEPWDVEASETYKRVHKKGDDAIAALVKKEAASAATNGATKRTPPPKVEQLVISHQLAPGRTILVGQGETFRVEVQAPKSPTGGGEWYARGRFASLDGEDMRSAWQLV